MRRLRGILAVLLLLCAMTGCTRDHKEEEKGEKPVVEVTGQPAKNYDEFLAYLKILDTGDRVFLFDLEEIKGAKFYSELSRVYHDGDMIYMSQSQFESEDKNSYTQTIAESYDKETCIEAYGPYIIHLVEDDPDYREALVAFITYTGLVTDDSSTDAFKEKFDFINGYNMRFEYIDYGNIHRGSFRHSVISVKNVSEYNFRNWERYFELCEKIKEDEKTDGNTQKEEMSGWIDNPNLKSEIYQELYGHRFTRTHISKPQTDTVGYERDVEDSIVYQFLSPESDHTFTYQEEIRAYDQIRGKGDLVLFVKDSAYEKGCGSFVSYHIEENDEAGKLLKLKEVARNSYYLWNNTYHMEENDPVDVTVSYEDFSNGNLTLKRGNKTFSLHEISLSSAPYKNVNAPEVNTYLNAFSMYTAFDYVLSGDYPLSSGRDYGEGIINDGHRIDYVHRYNSNVITLLNFVDMSEDYYVEHYLSNAVRQGHMVINKIPYNVYTEEEETRTVVSYVAEVNHDLYAVEYVLREEAIDEEALYSMTIDTEEPLGYIKTNVTLRLRDVAGVNANTVGTVYSGRVMNYYETKEADGYLWIRVSGGYIASNELEETSDLWVERHSY